MPLRLVVETLATTDLHLTAEDLIAELERRMPGIAPSTVYRVLQRLDDLGELEHVHAGGRPAFYHLSDHGHGHLMCTGCGRVTDVQSFVDDALRHLAIAAHRIHGFVLNSNHTALLGRCDTCSRQQEVIDFRPGDEMTLA